MKEYIKGLHHIGIPTRNMDDTIKFYSSFGAKIVFEKEDTFEGKPIRVVLIKFLDVILELYEREHTANMTGAIEHLAFSVNDIDQMYKIAKEKQYNFMEDCKDSIQVSTYWPNTARWFIVYGVNGEKIEFCQEME